MGRAAAPDWPRSMRRGTAAAYCDMRVADFEREVSTGRLPLSALVGGEERWDRAQLDEALDRLFGVVRVVRADWRRNANVYLGK